MDKYEHERDLYGYRCPKCDDKVLEGEPDNNICPWCEFDADLAQVGVDIARLNAVMAAHDAARN